MARRERAEPGLAGPGGLRGRSPRARRFRDAAVPAEPWRLRGAHRRPARAHECRLARREPAESELAGPGGLRGRPLEARRSRDPGLHAESGRVRSTHDRRARANERDLARPERAESGLAGPDRLRGRPLESRRSRDARLRAEPGCVRSTHDRRARANERRLARPEPGGAWLAGARWLRGQALEAGRPRDAAVPAEPRRFRSTHDRRTPTDERRVARPEPGEPGLAGTGRLRRRPPAARRSSDAGFPAEARRVRRAY